MALGAVGDARRRDRPCSKTRLPVLIGWRSQGKVGLGHAGRSDGVRLPQGLWFQNDHQYWQWRTGGRWPGPIDVPDGGGYGGRSRDEPLQDRRRRRSKRSRASTSALALETPPVG